MKVMLHGAINMSNYGDYIFAELFFDYLKREGHEVVFYAHPRYGISDYFAKYLGINIDKTNYWRAVQECDAFVFISGGYFTEPRKPGLISEIKHCERYMRPALHFMKQKKPILVLGVGAGPFKNKPYSRKARKVLNYASVVTVRDDESKKYCEEYSITRDIRVTSDTALVIREYLKQNKENLPKFEIEEGHKMLLLHIDGIYEVKERIKNSIVPAIRKFMNINKDYSLYIAADGIKKEQLYKEYEDMLHDLQPHILIYDDPWVLTKQIERADLIITTKLHMGIVGASLGCSVISFPFVPQKTKRFYKQIKEEGRCLSLTDVNEAAVYEMLDKYKNTPITVPNELLKIAKQNLELLSVLKLQKE